MNGCYAELPEYLGLDASEFGEVEEDDVGSRAVESVCNTLYANSRPESAVPLDSGLVWFGARCCTLGRYVLNSASTGCTNGS